MTRAAYVGFALAAVLCLVTPAAAAEDRQALETELFSDAAGTTASSEAPLLIPTPEPKTVAFSGQITGADVHSYADLVRFANLPKVVQPKWESAPLFFWVPAFKIVPNVFLRLGGMLTISPVENVVYDKIPLKSVYPVTLSQEEAEESLKIIFASLVVSKRKNYARLPGIHFAAEESELILLPFVSKGNELIYEKKNIAIQKVAMTYGKNF